MTSSPPSTATSPIAPVLPWWRRAIRVGYIVAVLVAFVIAIVARREELARQLSSLDPAALALSVVLGLAGVGLSGLVWRSMMTGLGAHMPLRPSSKVFFAAQLGKYLPGSVWPVVAQAEMARDLGIPRRLAVAGQTLFMWVHLVTGAIIGIPVLAGIGLVPRWTAVAALALIPLLLPGPLVRSMNWVLARIRRTPLHARPRGSDMAIACAWATLMWICYGLHIHFAVDALEFTAPGVLPMVVATGVFAAAWSAGFLFLVAPAGAGVRELVLIAGLSTVAASETALAVTLLSRLVLSVADGVWGGAGILLGFGTGLTTRPATGEASDVGDVGSGVDASVHGGPGDR